MRLWALFWCEIKKKNETKSVFVINRYQPAREPPSVGAGASSSAQVSPPSAGEVLTHISQPADRRQLSPAEGTAGGWGWAEAVSCQTGWNPCEGTKLWRCLCTCGAHLGETCFLRTSASEFVFYSRTNTDHSWESLKRSVRPRWDHWLELQTGAQRWCLEMNSAVIFQNPSECLLSLWQRVQEGSRPPCLRSVSGPLASAQWDRWPWQRGWAANGGRDGPVPCTPGLWPSSAGCSAAIGKDTRCHTRTPTGCLWGQQTGGVVACQRCSLGPNAGSCCWSSGSAGWPGRTARTAPEPRCS